MQSPSSIAEPTTFSPLTEDARSAAEFLEDASEQPVTISVHDVSRFEWSATIPLPSRGKLAYAIQADLEVPTNAVARTSPWDQLQTFTRLEGFSGPTFVDRTTIDAVRRGVVSLDRLLVRATEGFARHVGALTAASGRADGGDRYGFLVAWLEAALVAVEKTRRDLTQPQSKDSGDVGLERTLVDEYASVRLLEMLAGAGHTLAEFEASRPSFDNEGHVLARVQERIHRAIGDEIAQRSARGFPTITGPSPAELDAYVARAARLRKHFEQVMFLDRESVQLDERVQQWMTSFAALIAGGSAFILQLLLVSRNMSPTVGLGAHLFAVAAIAGACYVARDRIKEVARTWLTGKVYRFHAQRVSRFRVPELRAGARSVVVRASEWCSQTTQSLPDVLNPQGGASLARTRIRYLQKGVLLAQKDLASEGIRRVRHMFRYDVSPLLPRLSDEVRHVPYVDTAGGIQVAVAPRRYLLPVAVCLHYGGVEFRRQVTLVLEKRGITRADPSLAPDAFASPWPDEAAIER